MQNAFIAGTLIAINCGVISFFVVLRKNVFAAHSLGHISLAGSSGAVLIGLSAISGQLIANLLAGLIMGLLDEKIDKNDLSVGIILTFFLGLGAYFLFLYQNSYAGSIIGILFGNILSVSKNQIIILSAIAIVVVVVTGVIARPFFCHSLDPVLAEAQRIPVRTLSIIFFLIMSLTVTMACQIVGALLIFTLLVGPSAIAFQHSDGFYSSILLSVFIAISATWGSLTASFYINLPTSFCITIIICLLYFLGLLKKWLN